MRFTAYASASVGLAATVVLKALHERPNFYSACVYLGQSSACVMILTNLTLLIVGSFLFGLQKLLYGPLRPIEVEQIYEKAWFAITETCLAMTIFREEVGAWFIVMFVSLLVGKVWGWIGEGRVEVLEQQPPADPRLFHARLSTSLALSFLFTSYMLKYCINTVQQQARPNMMVMFAFEFAVLTVTSMSTCARYGLSLREAAVIRKQTAQKLQEQREVILREREATKQSAEENGETAPTFPPVEEEINELEIDVPGWEEKGRWTFYLDLVTDFLKLILYLTFFCVLCIFYGMPIHIIRDVALTVRSFYNRVTDFIKYRHATRDMNERYPDATAEEITREDTCIICREPMRPWHAPDAVQGEGPTPMEERLRPKKLPCGHILHFACLRSWLERQQKCPTCRQDVVAPAPAEANPQPRGDAPPLANNWEQPPAPNERANNAPRRNRVRFFNLGPVRLGFGAGNDPQALRDEMMDRPRRPPQQEQPNRAAATRLAQQLGLDFRFGNNNPSSTAVRTAQLLNMERQLRQEINSLNLQQQQLRVIRQLQSEFFQLRARQGAVERGDPDPGPQSGTNPLPAQGYVPSQQHGSLHSGHPDLPPGVTIPEGWQMTPLVPYSPQFAPLPALPNFSPPYGNGPNFLPFPFPNGFNQPGFGPPAVPPNTQDPNAGASTTSGAGTSPANNSTQAAAPVTQPQPVQDPRSNDSARSNHDAPATVDSGPVHATIPQWGTQSSGEPSTPPAADASSPTDARATGEAPVDKGKAKVPTVEDAADEEA